MPPLIPTLDSGKYHIKWTQLTDLPVPFWRTYVAVQQYKVYVTGQSPVEGSNHNHQVYVYDVNTNHWDRLPPSGHYRGVLHIIGAKLTIIGGRLSATNNRTNKVSTFNEYNQTWTSYYPDLLKVRSGPGVVSHQEHVIVAGGTRGEGIDGYRVAQDDIEILNWIENSHWRIVPIKLPVPMFSFKPIISDNHLVIVGFRAANISRRRSAYKIPVAAITLTDQQDVHYAHIEWIKMTKATHWFTSLIPNSSPPVIVGGEDGTRTATADIEMYNYSNHTWEKVGSLLSARSYATVSAIHNNAIIVIGGYTEPMDAKLSIVELGQAELLHHAIIDY